MPESLLRLSGIFFIFISFSAQARELWKDPQWLGLIHYKKHFNHYKSQADGKEFFLAGAEGVKNPQAELEATLKAFAKPLSDFAEPNRHPQCQFPARYLWLKSQLAWKKNDFPQITCDAYQKFKQREDAGSVTLIFSSYYLNNPSSAYGHTFLRLNKKRKPHEKRSDLLDHGVNYAAAMTTQNPVAYAVMGLSGMFRGVFTNVPYFYKVREYNDFESRDLWEYDLNLTQSEIDMLVAHIWELGSTYFDYYYITENCSYHMLTTLEAAAPRYDLTKKVPYYVIPSDTVKAVYETPGLVQNIQYRPSVRAKFHYRLDQLTQDQKKRVWKVLHAETITETDSHVLDAAIDYVDLKYGKKILKNDPQASALKQKLLLARSQIAETSVALEVPAPALEAPHQGHGSARTGLLSGYSDQTGPYLTLSHKFALHDLLDPQRGYPHYMEIDFVKFDIRYNTRDHHVWSENIDVINIFSLSDFSTFQKSPTWKLRFGATTFRDEACINCIGGFAEGGIGLSKALGTTPLTATLIVDAELSGSPKFDGSDVRVRFGPMAQIKASLGPSVQMMLRSQYRKSVVSSYVGQMESKAEVRWEFLKNIAFNAQMKYFLKPEFWEASGGILIYH